MDNRHCSNCCYSEWCQCDKVCEDYTPVGEQVINAEVDNLIESKRVAFYTEWFEYIADNEQ